MCSNIFELESEQQMKMFFWLSILAFIGIVAKACKSYSPQYLPKTFIQFGTGGGFVGQVNTYTVCKNGQIFPSHTFDSIRYERIGRKKAKRLFKLFDQNFLTIHINSESDNFYKILQYQKKDSLYTCLWSYSSKNKSTMQDSLFNELKKVLKKSPTSKK